MAETPGTWLIERGIGETRAALVCNESIIAARLAWPGELAAGAVVEGALASRASGSARGTVRLDSGEEVLIDRLPKSASEGASIRIAIHRARIDEGSRSKRAQGRPTGERLRPAPTLEERLKGEGHEVRIVRRFPVAGWSELIAEAFERQVTFDGGALHLSPTPAMTLIDIDGTLPPRALALAAVPAIAASLRRFDIGGSIGIDFPTLQDKADRRAVDAALGQALQGFAHERTAMNGFGFVQIVARMEGPSILHRVTRHRLAAAARLLLRRAEHVADPGAILLTVHPALQAKLKPEWIDELARRTGREIRIQPDPALAPQAGMSQAVPL